MSEERILIVEDDPGSIRLLQRILVRAGYSEIAMARTADEAVETFKIFDPDLVLLDLNLSGQSGFTFMDAVHELIPEDDYLPILVITVDLTREIRLEALRRGAKDFLTKPVDPAEVELRVRNFLNTRQLHRQLQDERQGLAQAVRDRTAELTVANDRITTELQRKSSFIAAICHEIRTPLTGVIGFAEVLWETSETLEPELNTELKGLVLDQARELQMLVDDLLVLVKSEAGAHIRINAESIFLDEVIFKALGILDHVANDRITLDNCHVSALADPLRLRQIIRNLADNAVTHGGPQIGISCEAKGATSVLRVSDDGAPIPQHVSSHMFDPYFTKPRESGTAPSVGLGLTICKELAERMSGEISYKREREQNVFELLLPAVTADAERTPEMAVLLQGDAG